MKRRWIYSFSIAVIIVVIVSFIPLPKSNETENGADRIHTDATYGLPLPFREDKSGGLTGESSVSINLGTLLIDYAIVSILLFGSLTVVSAARRKKS